MGIGWIRGCRIKLHPLFLVIALGAAWAGCLDAFGVSFAVVLYHELCHVLAAVLCGYQVTELELLPFGSAARIEGLRGEVPREEMLIALAGPAANLLMVMILATLERYIPMEFPQKERLIRQNLFMALFNLAPVLPMDGGRVFRGALASALGLKRATRLAADLGILGGMFMVVSAGVGWLPGQWLTGLLGISVLAAAWKERRESAWLWLRELTGKKRRLLQEETLPIRQIAVRWDIPLGQLTRRLIPHRYHLVTVVDENCTPIATVSEAQVVDGLMKKGENAIILSIIPRKG